MAYWIQEFGGNGKNSQQYRLFYCETDADIQDLPNMTDEGVQQGTDTVSNNPCPAGCEALVLDTADVYTLRKSTNTWEKLGG